MTTYQYDSEINKQWKPIQKPGEIVESRLVDAVLNGIFPINSHLPGERELAESLGVTRPTLREALQRLACDGWFEINHGKPTRVRDYLHEGKLGVLTTLSEHPDHLPDNFIPDLLNFRLAIAPMYTALAVQNSPQQVVEILNNRFAGLDTPEDFSRFDWELQVHMAVLGQNPVFMMILNSFQDMFLNLAPLYFSIPAACARSKKYYEDLAIAAEAKNAQAAETLTKEMMQESISYWQQTNFM
ncbi:MAG: GntR family transcriptional regulator [Brevefilum sp.]|jgi:GntR family negative regulator for fad regulon and positive regulator of fabA